jgi:hypothetical protein
MSADIEKPPERRAAKTPGKVFLLLFSLVLFVLFTGDSLYGQQRMRGRGGQQRGPSPHTWEKGTPPAFDTKPFNIAAEHLPPLYVGHDIELLYGNIKKASPALTGPPDLPAIYAFQINPTEQSYDRGTQILHVYGELSRIWEEGKEDGTRRGFRIKYQPQMDTRYTGTDIRGNTIEIEEIKFREFTVAFANFREYPVERVMLPSVKQSLEKKLKKENRAPGPDEGFTTEVIVGNIKLSPAEAKQLEERIVLLVVCNLVDPYTTSVTVHEQPTPRKPREYLAQYSYLNSRLLELWFYDYQTGKVLMKLKAGDHILPAPVER